MRTALASTVGPDCPLIPWRRGLEGSRTRHLRKFDLWARRNGQTCKSLANRPSKFLGTDKGSELKGAIPMGNCQKVRLFFRVSSENGRFRHARRYIGLRAGRKLSLRVDAMKTARYEVRTSDTMRFVLLRPHNVYFPWSVFLFRFPQLNNERFARRLPHVRFRGAHIPGRLPERQ